MELRKILVLLLVILIFGTAGFLGAEYYVGMHEGTHQQVFKIYHLDSEVRIGFLEGETIVRDGTNCNDYCLLATNITEIVGYHTGILILNLWLLLLAYLLIKYILKTHYET